MYYLVGKMEKITLEEQERRWDKTQATRGETNDPQSHFEVFVVKSRKRQAEGHPSESSNTKA